MQILLDCDGILADFATAYLNVVEKVTGQKYTVDQLTNYDYLKALTEIDNVYVKSINDLIRQKEFCASISVYTSAKEGFELLKRYGEIIIVTSPMRDAPYWMYERSVWLQTHFGIGKENIIFTSRKECVQGDIFIDDSIDMYEKWKNVHPNKNALLWARPWNSSYECTNKINCWDELFRPESPLRDPVIC